MGKIRVLLIEDHLKERMSLMRVFQDLGAQVDFAVTFERGKILAEQRTYDFIVSELVLSHCPELQGDGVQLWMEAKKKNPDAMILLIADEKLKNLALELLGDLKPRIIPKPVSSKSLKAVMRRSYHASKKISA